MQSSEVIVNHGTSNTSRRARLNAALEFRGRQISTKKKKKKKIQREAGLLVHMRFSGRGLDKLLA